MAKGVRERGLCTALAGMYLSMVNKKYGAFSKRLKMQGPYGGAGSFRYMSKGMR